MKQPVPFKIPRLIAATFVRLCGFSFLPAFFWLCACLSLAAAERQAVSDGDIADSLAAMLREARSVIASKQALIDDATLGDKSLDGKTVLAETLARYRQVTGADPLAIDPASRHGKLLRFEMDAIVQVMNQNQAQINAKGTGFKGFIPSVFARLVCDAFNQSANGQAQMKVTAPSILIRNRRARPDAWEAGIIATKFLASDWPAGKPFSAVVEDQGRAAYRMLVPEYYDKSCLACHGLPKGQRDITGFPMEGGVEGQLGGVISVSLYR